MAGSKVKIQEETGLNIPDKSKTVLLMSNNNACKDLKDNCITLKQDRSVCSSEMDLKNMKHKLPVNSLNNHVGVNEDSIPCKIPKVKMGETVTIDVTNIPNSTITSGAFEEMQIQNMEAKSSGDNSLLLNVTIPNFYYHALDMFPDVEHTYLTKLCNQESNLNDIISILLDNVDYPREKIIEDHVMNETAFLPKSAFDSGYNDESCMITSNRPYLDTFQQDSQKYVITKLEENVSSKSAQLEYLTQVLPDADHTFLESVNELKENELCNFINEAFENKNYPKQTVKPDEKIVNNDEELGIFTTPFNIEHFLKIFPDPVAYFMNESRKCQYSACDLKFLIRWFRLHTIKIIEQTYKNKGYNLSRTYEALESLNPNKSSKRPIYELKTPTEKNVAFLQEVSFLEHKAEIMAYLYRKADAKLLEYQLAKEKGELIDCGCCYESCLFEDCTTCTEGDLFCKSCVIKSAEVRIGYGLTSFPCLLACGAEFPLQLLQGLLDSNVFSRLIKRIQLEEVRAAGIEGLEVCPFCEFATIPPPDTNIFTCLNSECLKESCRKCHKISHIPQRCEEVESDDQQRARKYIENEMTRALVRECYKCKKSFIKTDGCNKMSCTCGAKMCYICRQPIKDYNHFNGPGGKVNNKCPLYSSEKVLHVDAVKAFAKQAIKNIKTTDPSIQLLHDPTKGLSTKAMKTLPPGGRENAADLIRRLNQPITTKQPHCRENPL